MRVAFDLDDTLIPISRPLETEAPTHLLLRWVVRERLRTGAAQLLRELIVEGHEVWIYTTSLRPVWMIKLLFRAYGVALAGVVNQPIHARWERQGSTRGAIPSKFPPAFGIDILVDDSQGVAVEGERHGFAVVRVAPSESDWANIVRSGLSTDGGCHRSSG